MSEEANERISTPSAAHQRVSTLNRKTYPSVISTLSALLLIPIVMAAAYFRFSNLNWDEDQHLHPDERFLTMVETGIQPVGSPPERLGAPPVGRGQLRDCKKWGGYFDTACSPLNPVNRGYGYYVYGTLPLFLVRYVGEALQQTGYGQISMVGRLLSALADMLTLLLLFATARRLYGERVALLAAALFAAAALPIQQSHYFTVDNFAVMFGMLTFYFAVRAQQEGGWLDFAAAGLALGAAVACKISVWPLAGIVSLAAVLWWSGGARRRPEAAMLKLALAGFLAMLSFRIFQPYAFAGPNFWNVTLDPGWASTMDSIRKLINGEQDAPFAHQWAYRAPVIFSWLNMVVWGMGLPLGLAVWAGWAFTGWQLARRCSTPVNPPASQQQAGEQDTPEQMPTWRAHLLPWLWASGFFIYQSTQWTKSIRYQLPIYPVLIMLAAYMLLNFRLQRPGRRPGQPIGSEQPGLISKYAMVALAIVVTLGAYAWGWGLTRIYDRPSTRVAASRWIYENVPTAATLIYQNADQSRSLQLTMPSEVTYAGKPITVSFKLSTPGTLHTITMNKLLDPQLDGEAETLRLTISEDAAGQNRLAQVEQALHLEQAPAQGGTYSFEFPPVQLEANHPYYFISQVVQGGPIVARGSALGNEHWDDGIPMRVDGRDGFTNYRGVQFENYNEDDEAKLANLVNWLSQADYINLTSNRLYGGIPRLPTRYPMTTEYYRALFSGQLGFEKVAEFTSYITVGPFEFPDQESTEMLNMPSPFDRSSGLTPIFLPPAEEAFSVYDHPRVVIYRKTADYSPERVSQILGRFDPKQRVVMWPKTATAAPTALKLDEDVWKAQQKAGTWSELYQRDSLLNRFPVLTILAWWALLALLGALAWPVVALAWPDLPDRGWGLARSLGLLVVGYLAWLTASLRLAPFGRGTLLAALLGLAIVSAAISLTSAARRSQLLSFLRSQRRLVLIEEAVFALTFGAFLLIRYGNGDLWHFYLGGERPMDFAYLNAVLKSLYFPPYDPWFSSGQMNYYYFGFVLVSVPIKLLGVVPALAYNIALPMLAALTASGAFSVAFNLFQAARPQVPLDEANAPVPSDRANTQVRPYGLSDISGAVSVGLLAVLFVVLMGNLGELKLIFDTLAQMGQSNFRSTIPGLAYTVKWMRGLGALLGGQPFPARLDWWYWNASRIMENGEINEFPLFTFLYGDLHAHMIALPLTMLMLGLGLGWALRRRWRCADAAISLLVGALVMGAARANNTWDYPTYLVIAFVGLFASGLHSLRPYQTRLPTQAGILAPPSEPPAGELQVDPNPANRAEERKIIPPKARPYRLLQALVSGGLGLTLFLAAWIMGGIDNLPTFLALATLLLVIGQLTHRWIEAQAGPSDWRWLDAAYAGAVGLSILYYLPYIQHYATAYFSVEAWKGARTPLNAYILIHGIFLFPIATYLIVQVRRLGWRWYSAAAAASAIWREVIVLILITFTLTWIAVVALGYGVALIVGPLAALAVLVVIRPRWPAAQHYILLLVCIALLITLAVEAVVLRGDIGRMNTVFKFYLQVWLMFSIASACMIGWLGQEAERRWSEKAPPPTNAAPAQPRRADRPAGLAPDVWLGWRVAMAALVAGGLTYSLFATRAKIEDRFEPLLGPTLDAMKFMTLARANEQGQNYYFADEYEALIWMQDNIQGTPVVAESALAPEYRSLRNRVTTYTGLPAIIGYNWHQKQQHSILPPQLIDQRATDVNELYSTTDMRRAVQLLKQYDVRYVMAGYPERLYYPLEGMNKFERMVEAGYLRVAYTNATVTIYEVSERVL